jgi:hypothetical protein
LNKALVLDFSDIGGPTIGASKADIRRLRAEHIDLLNHLAVWGELDDRPLTIPRYVEIALNIATHPIKSVILEFLEQSFVFDPVLCQIENPDIALS